jgi:flavin reductase (DIM6/NTAB) family NADH-FMN oxidoreductase RutF
MPVSADLFRKALSQFASGVTVVTARGAGRTLFGLTVSSFCSVSLDPPLVLVCVDRNALSHVGIAAAGWFGVNILKEDQEHTSRLFAGPLEKWDDVEVHPGPKSGAPRLAGALVFLECRLAHTYAGGDHTIFVGQVEHAEMTEGRPLAYFGGGYGGLAK